jgi:Fic family protein
MYRLEALVIYATPQLGFGELAALEKIEDLRSDMRYYVAEPRRWFGSVGRVLRARAIQGSNSIEGYTVSVEDAIAAVEGEDPSEAEDENWRATLGYRAALTYVLQLSRDPYFEHSTALIRSLHFMMTEYSLDAGPGLWRERPVWVRNDATGEIVYTAPDEGLVPRLTQELVDDLRSDGAVHPIVKGAMAHLNLVMIHPFRDGNGRMSRCLQTLVLARDQILAPEFCSIEEYLGENTDSYYRILGQVGRGRWNPEGDALPWVRYCIEAHWVQAMSVLRRIRESETMWSRLNDLTQEARLPERTLAALLDATIGLKVRNASYRALLESWDEGISNQVATTDLRAMVEAGFLQQEGKKRGTYYVAGAPLREIRSELRAARQRIDPVSLFDA